MNQKTEVTCDMGNQFSPQPLTCMGQFKASDMNSHTKK